MPVLTKNRSGIAPRCDRGIMCWLDHLELLKLQLVKKHQQDDLEALTPKEEVLHNLLTQ